MTVLIGKKKKEAQYPYRYRLEIKGKPGSSARTVEERINAMGGTSARVDPAGNRAVVLSKKIRTKKAFMDALAGTGFTVTDFEEII